MNEQNYHSPSAPQAWSDTEPTRSLPRQTYASDVNQSPRHEHQPHNGDMPYTRVKEPQEKRTSSIADMLRLRPLFVELTIVAIVCGALYGMLTWVVELVTTRISNEVGGTFLPTTDTTVYLIRGLILAAAVLVATAVIVLLHAAVNKPGSVFSLLFLLVALGAVIVLLTNPLWQGVPEVILIMIAAAIIWIVVPVRVDSYRTNVPRFRY